MSNVDVNQAYLFLIFILNGIFIGIIFDFFRILRRSFNTPNPVTYIEDVLFWTISAFSVLYTLFIFNNGAIRGYIFVGLLLGIILYMLFFSKTIMNISVKIILFFKEVIGKILKVVITPIKAVFKTIKKILSIFEKNASKCLLKMKNDVKNNQKLKIKSKKNKKLENKEGF